MHGRGRVRLPRRAWLGVLVAAAVWALPPAPASASAPPEFFGVSAVRPTQQDFQLMPFYGVGSYRLGLGWRGIQPKRRNQYFWGGPDQAVRWATESGIQIFPYLVGTPRFVSKRDDLIVPPIRRKLHRDKWRDFVAAAVARYGPGGEFWQENPDLVERPIRDWMIWNEENAQTFWKPEANPREYARLLRISREAMDEVDPTSRIVLGGIFGFPPNPKAMFAAPYLRKLYAKRGMPQIIDAISIHPYAGRIGGVLAQVRTVRRIARKGGDPGVELWIGEVGWASGGAKHELTKDPERQARLLRQAYEKFLAKRERWNIRTVMWFVWRDYEEDRICSWCPQAGLVDVDAQPKPSGRAYRDLVLADR